MNPLSSMITKLLIQRSSYADVSGMPSRCADICIFEGQGS